MASVDNLIVQNQLRTSVQSGGTLHLKGTGSRQPAVEKALVVQGGASFAGVVTVGTLDVGANVTVYGEVTADGGFSDVTTTAVTLDGVLTCPAVSTPAFARQYFVAPGGNATTGNGTVANPFASIGAALAAAYAAADTSACIVLAAGTYTESVSIDSSLATDIAIVGRGREEVTLYGNVVIDVGPGTGIGVLGTVSIMGISIFGKLRDSIYFQQVERQLVVKDCNVTSTGLGPAVWFGHGNAGTLHMIGCNIYCTAPAGFVNVALFCVSLNCILTNCKLTFASIAELNLGSALVANIGSASVSVTNCTFNLLLANNRVQQARCCLCSPGNSLLFQECTLNVQIANDSGLPFLIDGIFVNLTDYSYFIKNTFNVQCVSGIGNAVLNNGAGAYYSQGNVALPGSLTGYSNPVTPLATI